MSTFDLEGPDDLYMVPTVRTEDNDPRPSAQNAVQAIQKLIDWADGKANKNDVTNANAALMLLAGLTSDYELEDD